MKIYDRIIRNKINNKKQFAVLIDPDKTSKIKLEKISDLSNNAGVDYFFVGGSLLTNNQLDSCIQILKSYSDIPVILFPGNSLQISKYADAILLLSLISGRNPDLLIGKHVIAAPYLKESKLEIIPTAYMLIDSGKPTTAQYMSNTLPIPSDKNEIAVCTAMAGEMLGLQLIYMDAGSGAQQPISGKMINSIKNNIQIPLITGGGIKTPEKALENFKSGADIIVIGNAIEKSPDLILNIGKAIKS